PDRNLTVLDSQTTRMPLRGIRGRALQRRNSGFPRLRTHVCPAGHFALSTYGSSHTCVRRQLAQRLTWMRPPEARLWRLVTLGAFICGFYSIRPI
ncbi:hypothetical protein MUO98_02690, partial [Candidatus Bathyarchaeota archaeon]|nr:hypothetical protein [Candidatus Bathyarchaeota archaeon]